MTIIDEQFCLNYRLFSIYHKETFLRFGVLIEWILERKNSIYQRQVDLFLHQSFFKFPITYAPT
jgi:hypothetical protein